MFTLTESSQHIFNEVPFLYKKTNEKYIDVSIAHKNETQNITSPYSIISASGAVGKTAFARHLLEAHNAMVWDLSKLKLGTNTFIGSLFEATNGKSNLTQVVEDIKFGRIILVFDAVDEAQAHSGLTGVETFIQDVVKHTSESLFPSVFFISRRDTSVYLEILINKYTDNKGINLYDIDFFSKCDAIRFINNEVERHNGLVFLEKNRASIAQKFNEIISSTSDSDYKQPSLEWATKSQEEFFGYAPVLQTVAALFCTTNNVLSLDCDGLHEKVNIIDRIMTAILNREHEKLISALRTKNDELGELALSLPIYSPQDQLHRIIAFISRQNTKAPTFELDISTENALAIEESINELLPQHPFINNCTFAGPAFRDFTLATCLLASATRNITLNFLNTTTTLLTSLFADFYTHKSNHEGFAEDIPYILDSATSDFDKRYFDFIIYQENENDKSIHVDIHRNQITHAKLTMRCGRDIHFKKKLNNVTISIYGDITLGEPGLDFDIANSEIKASNICILAKNLAIRNINQESVFWDINNLLHEDTTSIICHDNSFQIYSQSQLNHPWIKFSQDTAVEHDYSEQATIVLHTICRILKWFRRDRREDYARYKNLIRKHIVGKGSVNRIAFGYLIHTGAVYEQGNLYLLDDEKLKDAGVYLPKLIHETNNTIIPDRLLSYLKTTPHAPTLY